MHELMARHRWTFVDRLRAGAAIAVALGHYFRAYGFPPFVPQGAWSSPFWALQDGFAAVALFFVVSGFVLSLHLEQFTAAGFLRFALKRVVRITVPFLVVLWCTAGLHATFPRIDTIPAVSDWMLEFWKTSTSVLMQSLLYAQIGSPRRLLPQDWSLTVELNLSIWTPWLVAVARRSAWLLIFGVVGAIAVAGVHALLLAFMSGILLARYRGRAQMILSTRQSIAAIAVCGLLLYSAEGTLRLFPAVAVGDKALWLSRDTGAFLIVLAVIARKPSPVDSDNDWLTTVGRRSFSVFLWHFPVLMYVMPLFFYSTNAAGIRNEAALWYAGLLAFLMVTFAVADLSYRLTERPSIALGHRIAAMSDRSWAHRFPMAFERFGGTR
jgi:peptidoglycan/LPS O-acetylase OafA/YrhL